MSARGKKKRNSKAQQRPSFALDDSNDDFLSFSDVGTKKKKRTHSFSASKKSSIHTPIELTPMHVLMSNPKLQRELLASLESPKLQQQKKKQQQGKPSPQQQQHKKGKPHQTPKSNKSKSTQQNEHHQPKASPKSGGSQKSTGGKGRVLRFGGGISFVAGGLLNDEINKVEMEHQQQQQQQQQKQMATPTTVKPKQKVVPPDPFVLASAEDLWAASDESDEDSDFFLVDDPPSDDSLDSADFELMDVVHGDGVADSDHSNESFTEVMDVDEDDSDSDLDESALVAAINKQDTAEPNLQMEFIDEDENNNDVVDLRDDVDEFRPHFQLFRPQNDDDDEDNDDDDDDIDENGNGPIDFEDMRTFNLGSLDSDDDEDDNDQLDMDLANSFVSSMDIVRGRSEFEDFGDVDLEELEAFGTVPTPRKNKKKKNQPSPAAANYSSPKIAQPLIQLQRNIHGFVRDGHYDKLPIPFNPKKVKNTPFHQQLRSFAELYKLDMIANKGSRQKQIILVRTPRTQLPSPEDIDELLSHLNMQLPQKQKYQIPRKKGKIPPPSTQKKTKSTPTTPRSASALASLAKPAVGSMVGAVATPIAEDNIGRRMLEKLGWQPGNGLGVANRGAVEPLDVLFRGTKKVGLGKVF